MQGVPYPHLRDTEAAAGGKAAAGRQKVQAISQRTVAVIKQQWLDIVQQGAIPSHVGFRAVSPRGAGGDSGCVRLQDRGLSQGAHHGRQWQGGLRHPVTALDPPPPTAPPGDNHWVRPRPVDETTPTPAHGPAPCSSSSFVGAGKTLRSAPPPGPRSPRSLGPRPPRVDPAWGMAVSGGPGAPRRPKGARAGPGGEGVSRRGPGGPYKAHSLSPGMGSIWVGPRRHAGGRDRCLLWGTGRSRRFSAQERIRVGPAARSGQAPRRPGPGALPAPWPSGARAWGSAWSVAWPG